MLAIQGLKCIYDTGARGWAIELMLSGEEPLRRFDVDSADDAEMLIEAFEDSSASAFDPATGEIIFAYEYADLDADDDEDEDEEAASGDELSEEEAGDDEEKVKG